MWFCWMSMFPHHHFPFYVALVGRGWGWGSCLHVRTVSCLIPAWDLFRSVILQSPTPISPLQGTQEAFYCSRTHGGLWYTHSQSPLLASTSFLWCHRIWETERLTQASQHNTLGRSLFLFSPELCEENRRGLLIPCVLLGDGSHIHPLSHFPKPVCNLYYFPYALIFEFFPVESWHCLRMGIKCR